jgi:hypothetical protein
MAHFTESQIEQIEELLIRKAKQWRAGPHFLSTISSDNTPFEQFDGFRARATFDRRWLFKAIVRQGYSGVPSRSLAKSLEFAQNEEAQWLAEHKLELAKFSLT